MTDQDQIKALAELDGWTHVMQSSVNFASPELRGYPKGVYDRTLHNTMAGDRLLEPIPSYLTSYDAIIPVIQKQPRAVQWIMHTRLVDDAHTLPAMFNSPPSQLCEALLRATGKWLE